jgi:hypothetical protein
VDGALQVAFEESPDLLANAFEKCGLWPFNPDIILAKAKAAIELASNALPADSPAESAGSPHDRAALPPTSSPEATPVALPDPLLLLCAAAQAEIDKELVVPREHLLIKRVTRPVAENRARAAQDFFLTSDEYIANAKLVYSRFNCHLPTLDALSCGGRSCQSTGASRRLRLPSRAVPCCLV